MTRRGSIPPARTRTARFDEIARLVERHERIGDLAALKDPEPAEPPTRESEGRRSARLPPRVIAGRARRAAAVRLRRLRGR